MYEKWTSSASINTNIVANTELLICGTLPAYVNFASLTSFKRSLNTWICQLTSAATSISDLAMPLVQKCFPFFNHMHPTLTYFGISTQEAEMPDEFTGQTEDIKL